MAGRRIRRALGWERLFEGCLGSGLAPWLGRELTVGKAVGVNNRKKMRGGNVTALVGSGKENMYYLRGEFAFDE